MKILILGASGFLGGKLYNRMKEEKDLWVLGTYHESKKDPALIKINVNDLIEVKTFLEHYRADVVIWCLMGNGNESELINIGLNNVLNNITYNCKFIFMSTNAVFGEGNGHFKEDDEPSYKNSNGAIALYSNAKIEGEKTVSKRENYIIIRPGAIYGQDIYGKWDKRVSSLIEDLSSGKKVFRSINLISTFVQVDELTEAILKLIRMEYKGIIHLGPEKKESYYEYYKRMARNLQLDESLILPNMLDEAEANEKGIIMDSSLNTRKCREELGIMYDKN